MALKRIMPCLLYTGQNLVKTVNFKNPSYIGDPINAIKIYNEKEVDELVLLDINATKENRPINFGKIEQFASECFMPFSYGGGVRTLDDFAQLFKIGVEKVIVNSLIFDNPQVVRDAVNKYASSSVVASIDVKSNFLGKRSVFSHAGRKTEYDLQRMCAFVQDDLKVGEILITSVDREGTWQGYDYDLTQKVVEMASVPVIANGGAGEIDHIKKVLYQSDANAAALGSMAVYQKKGMGVLIKFPARENVIIDEQV
ncbi:AglZ/HisF2 family acetamidino modification protein [Fulvivirgaceae bacterium PWU4]|uniref:imidazole glycerol-phosphate synthase n=1 Tax=Chryseosolibacter histidini TaxID=2782349 RepID=A0AAP2DR21_9BACT|nr:AglZ/HisF2 family acetamidino modification protein [Chryseosolibacter histidini]MBT1700916.1 AglZ/HisF2 family acetamidino modification protein [Chryseosolibacter histidini]